MPAKLKTKNKTSKEKAVKKPRMDRRIERIYEEWVEFICPIRGKVRQKVKIVRYKTAQYQYDKQSVNSSTGAEDQLDQLDDGMHIYSPEEEKEQEDS